MGCVGRCYQWQHDALTMTVGGVQGEAWDSALAGHVIDPLQQEEERKRLMLERFQREVRPRLGDMTQLRVLGFGTAALTEGGVLPPALESEFQNKCFLKCNGWRGIPSPGATRKGAACCC